MKLQENTSTKLRRRIHLLDMVINNMLPNMYPCDYNSSDHFVEGVLDEIRWFLLDFEELQGIERIDIENYILDHKYDELTNYFNERCIVLKNDYIQESIKRILKEERSIERNLKAIRELLDTIDVDGLCEIWVKHNNEDGDYEIRSKTTTIYYKNADLMEEFKYIEDTIRSWGLSVLILIPRLIDNCEDEKFLKESKKRILKEEMEVPIFLRRRFKLEELEWLVNDIKEMIQDGESLDTEIYDGIRQFVKGKKFSDIDEFGTDQNYWESYLKYERPLVDYVKKKLEITDDINESITKVIREETNYLPMLEEILNHIGQNYCVCGIDYSYDEEDDIYTITLCFSTEELNKKFGPSIRNTYVRVVREMVKQTIKSYLPIPNIYVASYAKPTCGENNLQESKQNNQNLNNLLNEFGLYFLTKSVGLSYDEIETRVENISREDKIQYIKDLLNELDEPFLDLTMDYNTIKIGNDDGNGLHVEYLSNFDNILKIEIFDDNPELEDEYLFMLKENEITDQLLDVMVKELIEMNI